MGKCKRRNEVWCEQCKRCVHYSIAYHPHYTDESPKGGLELDHKNPPKYLKDYLDAKGKYKNSLPCQCRDCQERRKR